MSQLFLAHAVRDPFEGNKTRTHTPTYASVTKARTCLRNEQQVSFQEAYLGQRRILLLSWLRGGLDAARRWFLVYQRPVNSALSSPLWSRLCRCSRKTPARSDSSMLGALHRLCKALLTPSGLFISVRIATGDYFKAPEGSSFITQKVISPWLSPQTGAHQDKLVVSRSRQVNFQSVFFLNSPFCSALFPAVVLKHI